MNSVLIPQGIFADQGSSSQTGGGAGNPHGTFSAQVEDDGSVTYTFNPLPSTETADGTWDDFYMLGAKFGAWASRFKHYAYEFTFMFPTEADIQACEAVELDMQTVIAGAVTNMGWQYRFSGGTVVPYVSAFQYAAPKGWAKQPQAVTPLPLPGVPFTLRGEHLITPTGQEHVAFSFYQFSRKWAGNWQAWSRTLLRWPSATVPNVYPGATDLAVAFQADSRGQGVPFRLNVSGGMVECW